MIKRKTISMQCKDANVSKGELTKGLLENPTNKYYYKCYYHPSTKLQEGNVFSHVCVCLSFHPQGGPMWPLPIMHWTSLYRVLPPCRGTHLCTGPTLASDIWWPRLDTCSNSFTWGSPMVLTSGGGYCRSIYSHCKQAVSILLECFLVFFVFFISTSNGIKWVWLH